MISINYPISAEMLDTHFHHIFTTNQKLLQRNWHTEFLVLSFSISYWDLIKFPYFTDTTERGGPKTG
jgi:hypothetical protein